ncbi:MAG: aminotransferase class III-fold pyridoxal phosphate-dependent enzyme, partial [Rhodospirillaceae bacterium]|nr:aminotransferase class III-fold pyridoxal phosphate-dependent enzyme [Rhodospirillaceae bacterium]
MQSTRLPGKVMADLGGRPVIAWTLSAARRIRGLDTVVVATSDNAADNEIAAWCKARQAPCYRGPQDDVLERFRRAAVAEDTDVIMRLTADCPFLDPYVCELVLGLFDETGVDYASNIDPPTWPDGLDCEVFSRFALESAAKNAQTPDDREHVTPYIRNRHNLFSLANMTCPIPGLHRLRWTVDEVADLTFARNVANRLGSAEVPSHLQILALLRDAPEMAVINRGIRLNQGAEKTRKQWPNGYHGYEQSNLMLERAERVIPLGTQTFSKSWLQYPRGIAPLYLTHGRDARVWDVDGHRYVDMVCGLLPVILGYCDPDIDQAIREQLGEGITFSLAHRLEADLAERLVELIPCAEATRFGKNGSDATSAAVRLARAYTRRDRIAVCGYHGWQDWYIGATVRNKGVPKAVSELTSMFPYNDIEALHGLLNGRKGEFAAVMLEPVGRFEPEPGYLEAVQGVANKHGALLIFDEIITGFRVSLGGAQEYYGVTPDLSAFGKGMANGMPLSAVVGRQEVMKEMEEIFYSGTFGGETLSLAAAIAVIDKMRREPVVPTLWQRGEALAASVTEAIAQTGLESVITLGGLPPWTVLTFKDHPKASAEAVKTLFVREMLKAGVLINSSHNVCYSLSESD